MLYSPAGRLSITISSIKINLTKLEEEQTMYQIDNEKFGTFLSEMRKEKDLTQKELGEKLFVSDKTVSKWERGASIPNVTLLIPIADVLGITVTELLKGERITENQTLKTEEVETLVVNSLDLSVRNSVKQHKKNWILAFLLSALIIFCEMILIVVSGISISTPAFKNLLLLEGMILLFSGWFCLLAKDLLPTYYDNNKINFVSQGVFHINIVGLSFNNGNWPYICTVSKIFLLGFGILLPIVFYIICLLGGLTLWNQLEKILILVPMMVWLGVIYLVGKKYE